MALLKQDPRSKLLDEIRSDCINQVKWMHIDDDRKEYLISFFNSKFDELNQVLAPFDIEISPNESELKIDGVKHIAVDGSGKDKLYRCALCSLYDRSIKSCSLNKHLINLSCDKHFRKDHTDTYYIEAK